MSQKPTIGRIVHVFSKEMAQFPPNGVGPYAAIITAVHSDAEIDVHAFPVV